MTDQHNPWAGPDGLKAIKVLEDAGLLHILWKWGKGMVHAFGDVAASEISIPHYRDAARVFMRKHKMSYGYSDNYELKYWFGTSAGSKSFTTSDERDIAAVLAVAKEKT